MLKEDLSTLRKKDIYFGTSSWKYEGWRGLIYSDNYSSEKAFNEKCLEEYAKIFPIVGVDHTYYAWPSPSTFEKYLRQVPEDFRLVLKATEAVTVYQYPKLKRYGKLAGKTNETFLNAEIFLEKFLKPLEPFKQFLGPVMFEFSQFYPGMVGSGKDFTTKLCEFINHVQQPGFSFAVELRNGNWLQSEYYQTLSSSSASPVYNSWTRVPSIGEQLDRSREHHFPCLLARLLLKPGRKYEQAVEAFAPYREIQEELPDVRHDTASLVERAIDLGVPAYILVNNRLEGCAPKTIEGVIALLKARRPKIWD